MRDRVKALSRTVLCENWNTLARTEFDYRRSSGSWQRLARETYEGGDGAGVLLYNVAQRTVILTRQFRFPAYQVGEAGDLIEVCAGKLDGDDPVTAAKKEAEEESGYRVTEIEEVMAGVYMSPGSVTERLWLYIAAYDATSRVSDGGGLVDEGEDIEVIEMGFDAALEMVANGEIRDAKTVLLLQHVRLRGIL
jgi:GDP-mannose pyrophosphatase NudK